MSHPRDVLYPEKVPLVMVISDGHRLDEEVAGVAGNQQVEPAQLWVLSVSPLSPKR